MTVKELMMSISSADGSVRSKGVDEDASKE